jgi:hypothetical protein
LFELLRRYHSAWAQADRLEAFQRVGATDGLADFFRESVDILGPEWVIFVDGQVIRHKIFAIAPADDGIAAGGDHPLHAEAIRGMMDVKRSNNIGLVGHRGGGNVGIMNGGEMDRRVNAIERLHHLTKILDITD